MVCIRFIFARAQEIKDGRSYWYFRTKEDKEGFSDQFSFGLDIKGKKISGGLEFRGLDHGEGDGGDGSSTPFVGKIVGDLIKIEFNNADWRNAESIARYLHFELPTKDLEALAGAKNRHTRKVPAELVHF